MSDTCSLFPSFADPWLSCLLPSHDDEQACALVYAEVAGLCANWDATPFQYFLVINVWSWLPEDVSFS